MSDIKRTWQRGVGFLVVYRVALIACVLALAISDAYGQGQNELPDTLDWGAVALVELAQRKLHEDPQAALRFARASMAKAATTDQFMVKQQAQKVIADALQYSGQYAEAKALYRELLDQYIISGQTERSADVYNELANVNAYQGRYELALQYYQDAYAIQAEQEDQTGMAKLSNNIGLLHFRLGDYDKAADYYQKALQFNTDVNDPRIEASTYTNIGYLLSKQEQHQKALQYQERAAGLYEAMSDKMRWANAFINIGLEHEMLGAHARAATYFRKAYEEAQRSGHQVIAVDALNKLGKVLTAMDEQEEAFGALTQAYTLAQTWNDPALLNELHQNFSNYYQHVGDHVQALHYFQRWSSLKDSIINQQNLNRIAELEILHQTAQQQQEIRLLEQRNTRQRLIILLTVITTGLLALSALLLWSRSRIRISLLEKEQELQRQENERKALENEKENLRLQNELQLKNSELSAVTMLIYQKNELLTGLGKAIDQLKSSSTEAPDIIREMKQHLRNSVQLDEDWQQFKQHFEQVHPGFFEQLNDRFPALTQNDHRHCAYIRMNLSTKEIARLLNITPASVQRSRVRLKKKLSLEKNDHLVAFIRDL